MEQAMRPGADVLAGVKLVATAKEVLPDGWPIFLVWEYGLEELLPYLPDPRVILVTGLQWQRLQGTPASLKMALGWLGLDNAKIEQEDPYSRHWYEYQIDPGKVPTREEIRNIVGLANLSAPVGTRLARLVHGYDRRRGIYDYTVYDDGSLYDGNSGIWDPETGIDLSFGREIATYASIGELVPRSAVDIDHTSYTLRGDHPVYDVAVYDDGLRVRDINPGIDVEGAWLTVAGIPRDQPDVGVYERAKVIDEYGWGAVPWGARTWTEPAQLPD